MDMCSDTGRLCPHYGDRKWNLHRVYGMSEAIHMQPHAFLNCSNIVEETKAFSSEYRS